MDHEEKTVVVVGASPKPHRFANRALRLLKEQGYRVIPVHPVYREIEGLPVVSALEQVAPPVDTVTLYVGCDKSRELAPALLALRPRRVIFNPGAECPELEKVLTAAGITCLRACTIVLLRCGEF
ncbi:MAG: CoA-binding protein [candidate division KSB1 bacterium]|nr:CoA-binding protein [candidate division KSB1 bacterium]MDZ7386688.1 CoA-binding protein [candidate division KSB1 bacterium]MDZ7393898.1 CoA-binding protein [candidate division KSB1 bacterium]MDZ7412543.1 CoA-binding protein [candidate division KSB1 bacterium]